MSTLQRKLVRQMAIGYIVVVIVAFVVLAWSKAEADAYRAKVHGCMEFETQADCETMRGVR